MINSGHMDERVNLFGKVFSSLSAIISYQGCFPVFQGYRFSAILVGRKKKKEKKIILKNLNKQNKFNENCPNIGKLTYSRFQKETFIELNVRSNKTTDNFM